MFNAIVIISACKGIYGAQYLWNQHNWDSFGTYATNPDRVLKAEVLRFEICKNTGRISIVLKLLNRTTEKLLEPKDRFWFRSGGVP